MEMIAQRWLDRAPKGSFAQLVQKEGSKRCLQKFGVCGDDCSALARPRAKTNLGRSWCKRMQKNMFANWRARGDDCAALARPRSKKILQAVGVER